MAESIKEGFEREEPPTTTNQNIEVKYEAEEPAEIGRWGNLLSRKFIISLVVFLASTYLFSNNTIDEDIWMTITMFVFGAYVTGNVFQNIGMKK